MHSVGGSRYAGWDVVDDSGSMVGKLEGVVVDTPAPGDWGQVRLATGTARTTMVPLGGAAEEDGRLRLAFGKQIVVDAPSFDASGPLPGDPAKALFEDYYADAAVVIPYGPLKGGP